MSEQQKNNENYDLIHLIKKNLAERKWQQAEVLTNKLLSEFKHESYGYYFLGMIRLKKGHHKEAKVLFEQSLKFDARHESASIELAEIYLSERSYDQALSLLMGLKRAESSDAYYLYKAAKCYKRLYKLKIAHDLMLSANSIRPGKDEIISELADLSVATGNLDCAKKYYLDLLQKNPSNQRYHYELSVVERAQNDNHIKQMTQLIQSAVSTKQNTIFLDFACGKEHEDLENWKMAFEHYKKGGEQAKKLSLYNVRTDLSLIKAIKENFSFNSAEATTVSDSNPVPIFLTGVPRSGTTLLDKILSVHRDIVSADESFFFQTAMQLAAGIKPLAVPTAESITTIATANKNEIAKIYFRAINHRLDNTQFFIEKLPENFLYLGLIAACFPQSKLVFVERNPMDLALALFKQPYFRYSYTLDDLAQFYIDAQDLVKHWTKILGNRLIVVSYEDVVVNTEATIKSLFSKLEIEYDDNCLNFHKYDSVSTSASKAQIRQPIHTNSVGKWRNFSDELGAFKEHLIKYGIHVEE